MSHKPVICHKPVTCHKSVITRSSPSNRFCKCTELQGNKILEQGHFTVIKRTLRLLTVLFHPNGSANAQNWTWLKYWQSHFTVVKRPFTVSKCHIYFLVIKRTFTVIKRTLPSQRFYKCIELKGIKYWGKDILQLLNVLLRLLSVTFIFFWL